MNQQLLEEALATYKPDQGAIVLPEFSVCKEDSGYKIKWNSKDTSVSNALSSLDTYPIQTELKIKNKKVFFDQTSDFVIIKEDQIDQFINKNKPKHEIHQENVKVESDIYNIGVLLSAQSHTYPSPKGIDSGAKLQYPNVPELVDCHRISFRDNLSLIHI